MITFQKLIRADARTVAEINALLSQLSSSAKPLVVAQLAAIIKNNGIYVLVARDGKKIIGMGSLVTWPAPTGIHSRVEDVVVDVTYRGQGIGDRLMKKLITQAKKARAKNIELSSRPSRVAANNLYRRLGFERKETNVYSLKL